MIYEDGYVDESVECLNCERPMLPEEMETVEVGGDRPPVLVCPDCFRKYWEPPE